MEDLHDRALDRGQLHRAAFSLEPGLQGDERSDSEARDVSQPAAVDDDPRVTGVEMLLDELAELVRRDGVEISLEHDRQDVAFNDFRFERLNEMTHDCGSAE